MQEIGNWRAPHHTDLWDAIGPSFFKLIIAHLFESSSLRCYPEFFLKHFSSVYQQTGSSSFFPLLSGRGITANYSQLTVYCVRNQKISCPKPQSLTHDTPKRLRKSASFSADTSRFCLTLTNTSMTFEGPCSNKTEQCYQFARFSLHQGKTQVQTSDEAIGFT